MTKDEALRFYADETRYNGPNQRLEEPDSFSEAAGLKEYRLDVLRDRGAIARSALAASAAKPPKFTYEWFVKQSRDAQQSVMDWPQTMRNNAGLMPPAPAAETVARPRDRVTKRSNK